jgi:uncharacterized membrane protein YfcA
LSSIRKNFVQGHSSLMLVKILILVAIGLLTGTVTAISAGSGVTIVVPLLTIFLGYTIHEAIGTSLLVDVIASIIVAYNYYRYGKIDIKSGAWLALGAVIGAQIGSHFASFIPQGGLKGGFSVFIIIFGKRKFSLDILKFDNKTLRLITIIAIGLFIGLSTGLFGTGGGATILVVLIYLMDFPIHTAIGTATALMAITAASGVVGYTIQGHIPWLDGIIIGAWQRWLRGSCSARWRTALRKRRSILPWVSFSSRSVLPCSLWREGRTG